MFIYLVLRLLAAGRIFLAALVLATTFTACGGGGGGTPEADTTAPVATSAQAIVGTTVINLMTPGTTNVPVNALFAFTWNEGIEPCAQTGSFGALSGTATCVNNTAGLGVITLVAAPPPQYLAHYDVVVTAVDAAGNVGTFSTWWVTEAAPDTTPPVVLSASIANSATGISVTPTSVVLTLSEPAPTCDASKPVTLTSEFYSVVGTTTCAGATVTFTPSTSASRLFYKTAHTLRLPAGSVKDAAGNPLATDYALTFTTEGLPITGPQIYTANGAAALGSNNQITLKDLGTGEVFQHFVLPGGGTQLSVVGDQAAGYVYTARTGTSGVYRIDVATRAVLGLKAGSDPFEYVDALKVRSDGVYAAYSNNKIAPKQPELRRRVVRFDRQTGAILAKSAPIADESMSPTAIITHPDAAVKRIYVLSATVIGGMDVIDGACRYWAYQPATRGLLTVLHSETLEQIDADIVVGSVPLDGVIDRVGNRLIVANTGDRTFSEVNLTTRVVTTTQPLAGFTGCRQPVRVMLDADHILSVSNAWDGVHHYDLKVPGFAETYFVATGDLSLPIGLASAAGKAYVTLWGDGYNAVVEIVGGSITQTLSVGPGPFSITAIVP